MLHSTQSNIFSVVVNQRLETTSVDIKEVATSNEKEALQPRLKIAFAHCSTIILLTSFPRKIA